MDYEKTYEVYPEGGPARYVNTMDEVREIAKSQPVRWVRKGYADMEEVMGDSTTIGGTFITRRTTGEVHPRHWRPA